jgi:hypothetical protein
MLQASASETFLYDNFCLSFSHIFKFACIMLPAAGPGPSGRRELEVLGGSPDQAENYFNPGPGAGGMSKL